jgi:catechol 2,3-dioxygenase-like lactoylglutathione lyase family enzyme
MDWTLEVVVVPVGDVDRAIAFYRDQLGLHLDHDTRAGDQRFAQLTPRGSGCSIVLSEPPPMPAGR